MLIYYLFKHCTAFLTLLLIFIISLMTYSIVRMELPDGKFAHRVACIIIACVITIYELKFLMWDFAFSGFILLKILFAIIEISLLSYTWGTAIYKYVVKS